MNTPFDTTAINGMEVANRFVRAPTWEGMAGVGGRLTGPLVRLYRDLAAGGVGLVITGYAAIAEGDTPSPRMMGMYREACIEDYRKLTDAVHREGGKIALQIAYGGSQTMSPREGATIWGPSAVRHLECGVTPSEIQRDGIRRLVRCFGDAAQRGVEAGFDGVEIHGASGYFLSQFLTPYYNRRRDEYGGAIENRMRILMEVVSEVRSRVDASFPVIVKVNCQDFMEGGLTFGESRQVCRALARHGVDAIEITGGFVYRTELNCSRYHITTQEHEAYFEPYAAVLAREIAVPVILDGGIRSLEVAERIFGETAIGHVGLSRPLIAEPHLIRRWMAGDRRKSLCISCGKCVTPEGSIACPFRNTDAGTG